MLSSNSDRLFLLSEVTDHIDLYCNASGDPLPIISWYSSSSIEGGFNEIIVPDNMQVFINTTYPSAATVRSRLILFNIANGAIQCVASNGGYSPNKTATFVIGMSFIIFINKLSNSLSNSFQLFCLSEIISHLKFRGFYSR